MAVRLPGEGFDPEGSDLSAPLTQFLRDLSLLEAAGADVGLVSTPYSLQVIRAGALALNKAWAGFAGATGVSGMLTALGGAWRADDDSTRIAMIIGGSIVAAAAVLAIALIVRGDVGARAATTTAQYNARRDVAISFVAAVVRETVPRQTISSAVGAQFLDALAFNPPDIRATSKGRSFSVRGVRRKAGEATAEVRDEDGDWIVLDHIDGFTVERS